MTTKQKIWDVVIEVGTCGSGALVYLSAICPSAVDADAFRRQFYFDSDEVDWGHWHDVPAKVTDLCVARLTDDSLEMLVLTDEGQVGTADGEVLRWTKIAGSGVHSTGALNYGYMNRLRCIEGVPYAVGNSGQVYQRKPSGTWEHMDRGLLQAPIAADTDIRTMIDLNDIAGSSTTDLYACGDFGQLHHFDGTFWKQLEVDEHVGHLGALLVVSAGEIYAGGANGILLKGNARDGFKDISPVHLNSEITALATLSGAVVLATTNGLFQLHDGQFAHMATGLVPELEDVHTVEAADDRLWCFGYRDIAYFDGTTWTRVVHPDNVASF